MFCSGIFQCVSILVFFLTSKILFYWDPMRTPIKTDTCIFFGLQNIFQWLVVGFFNGIIFYWGPMGMPIKNDTCVFFAYKISSMSCNGISSWEFQVKNILSHLIYQFVYIFWPEISYCIFGYNLYSVRSSMENPTTHRSRAQII